MSDKTEQSRQLMYRVTDEIWNSGRIDLVDELIARSSSITSTFPASREMDGSDTELLS
jgi:hypothetical protein